ncbi:MAG: hypothetical protein JOZ01_03545, partial [Candidatus Eremiobacteraeota bacterium]|nr:hypothetical protein [Candidatus Eremiobacteraeota bacterium]
MSFASERPRAFERISTAGATLVAAAIAFVVINGLAFYGALYRAVLDPASTTGAFESAVARLSAVPANRTRDVLVLGDSRIYSGLDPAVASAAAGGRLRFLDGSVPGTTPRCWFFLTRAVDPNADRYRAIVIPLDTYGDDDSAIGSIDGDFRELDLHYIVFRVRPTDIRKLAESFGDRRAQLNIAASIALRGPLLREDVQA